MQVLKCDAKGRIYLRESLRERYGCRFLAVPAPGELVLVPVPAQPVSDLRSVARSLRGRNLPELRSIIEEEAQQQVVA